MMNTKKNTQSTLWLFVLGIPEEWPFISFISIYGYLNSIEKVTLGSTDSHLSAEREVERILRGPRYVAAPPLLYYRVLETNV